MNLRRAFFILALFAAPALRAAGWEQVTLFDWVYPSEPAYTALQKGVQESGIKHWLNARLASGDKLPQASARDLAALLMDDPKVDDQTKAVLKEKLSTEAQQLGMDSQAGALGQADALSHRLDVVGKRMDEIETIYKTNNYGKSNTPSLNLDVYTAFREDDPGGFLEQPGGLNISRRRSYLLGGANFTLNATVDKANFGVGLGLKYWGGDNTADNTAYQNFTIDSFANFQMPLDQGGIEVHLGDKLGVYLSPLLFGALFQEGREAFFVDVTNPYRPTPVIKILDLEYPAFTKDVRGVYVRRQGQAWYWPFSTTQLLYEPDNEWWLPYDTKVTTYAGRVDRDIHPTSWMDPGLWYLMAQRADKDKDQLQPFRTGGGAAVPSYQQFNIFPGTVESYGVGFELHLVKGTQLKFDGAYSNSIHSMPIAEFSPTSGPARTDADFAAIATLVQPIGPFNLAFEGGWAGPLFLSKPQSNDRIQNGAVMDSLDPLNFTAGPPKDPYAPVWATYMHDPAVMTNNNARGVLKAEWHGSWVSIGLYGGSNMQITPTGATVIINPVLEGRDDNGYGLFREFGTTYALPYRSWDPGLAYTRTDFGELAQQKFNQAFQGVARYGSAPTQTNAVYWQEISQLSYREIFYTVLLTQNGKGDNNLLAPSLKAYNFAGTRTVLDFGALFNRTLPSTVTLIAEDRELVGPGQGVTVNFAPQNLFSQAYGTGVWTHGITELLTVLVKGSYETWKSQQSYYPVDIIVRETGAGFDLRLDPFLTGLQANLRATDLRFEDLNMPSHNFSLWTLSIGTTLSY
jgi:hypothetical protein